MTQQEALDILKLGHNVFLTGSAGSGKTFLLNQYINYLKKNNVPVAITASTGIAATHLGGMTIHSWSGLGIRSSLSQRDFDDLESRRYLWDRFQKTKVLIIDEVSMLDSSRFDMVDALLRMFRRTQTPFGGLQVVLCGDFFQLPPIFKSDQIKSDFVYKSHAWKEMELKICYLHEQHRQEDDRLLGVLSDIRRNRVTRETWDVLRSRSGDYEDYPDVDSDNKMTKLYTHNVDVDAINNRELEAISGQTHTYKMSSSGNPNLATILTKSCLAPEILHLKKGSRVMFVKNNYEAGYVNGTLGTIVGFDSEGPIVRTNGGLEIVAKPTTWAIEEDGKIKAQIAQTPLRLAWAITVHKSQGMSLDSAVVDLSKSFEKGMGYVALSRVRTLDGLFLLGLNDRALEVSLDVLDIDQGLIEVSDRLSLGIRHMDQKEKEAIQIKYIDSIVPKITKEKKVKEKISTLEKTKLLLNEKISLKEMAKQRGVTLETILSHLEKLVDGGEIDAHEQLSHLIQDQKKFQKIKDAFEIAIKETGQMTLSPVKNILGSKASFNDIRIARLFLKK